ncbi:hypothetical protein PsAD2_03542 [Pseudovibrio axinellae]|uniref:DDE domain-containing protein n=1 Tax=Pseudovibrio axinellae TaxID=989403 RepID=A0A165VZY4_9HYPH|nr:IS6 family transposase [Pseudovibrio axinellae]KZL15739.1 hypothetical protein PsAD2_03542 [Pseudovibrio axinellae]
MYDLSSDHLQTPSFSTRDHSSRCWLYHRFSLSLREVEEMLLERGILVSIETIRRWGIKFGPAYVGRLRRKKASNDDVWYLDEVVVKVQDQRYYLWRAVDQDDYR